MKKRAAGIPRKPTVREREVSKALSRARAKGQSHAELAAELGVSVETVKWWAWRIGYRARGGASGRGTSPPRRTGNRGRPKRGAFVEVQLGDRPSSAFEVVLGREKTLRIPAGFDASELRRLLAALEPTC